MSAAFGLSGKVALVTGATSGIGLATAELGARFLITSEKFEDCDDIAERLDGKSFPCDLLDFAALQRLPAQVEALVGGLDLLVLNAGIPGRPGPISELDMSEFGKVMAINLEAPLRLAKEFLPLIARRGGGCAVLMSSIAGLRGNGAIGAYALSKAALAQLARNLAVEWGPRNVRVNAVWPGLIRTPLSQPVLADEEFMAHRLRMTPLRRAGEAREVAGAVAFLAAPAGAFVTGHNLVVDGGTIITDGT